MDILRWFTGTCCLIFAFYGLKLAGDTNSYAAFAVVLFPAGFTYILFAPWDLMNKKFIFVTFLILMLTAALAYYIVPLLTYSLSSFYVRWLVAHALVGIPLAMISMKKFA